MTETNDKTLNELNELLAFFIEAEDDMRTGKVVDMSDVDDRIGAACEAVQTASEKKQEIYLPILNDLLKKLNSCEVTMHSIQNDLTAND